MDKVKTKASEIIDSTPVSDLTVGELTRHIMGAVLQAVAKQEFKIKEPKSKELDNNSLDSGDLLGIRKEKK